MRWGTPILTADNRRKGRSSGSLEFLRNHLGVVGVHEDGGVGVADAGGDGRGEHRVQEELLLGLQLELVRGARLGKLPHAGRHRGAHAEQRRGHRVHVA